MTGGNKLGNHHHHQHHHCNVCGPGWRRCLLEEVDNSLLATHLLGTIHLPIILGRHFFILSSVVLGNIYCEIVETASSDLKTGPKL